MKILVTGAGGFIGKNLIRRLKNKHQIIALEKNRKSTKEFKDDDVRVEEIDLLHNELSPNFLQDTDLVVHLAGNPSSVPEFHTLLLDNVVTTDNVLALCSRVGIKKFILASTIDVYGTGGIFSEEDTPRPSNQYGLSKLFAEELCRLYDHNFGVKSIVLRFASVYGPDNKKGLFFTLLDGIQKNNCVQLSGTGEQKRNSVYIDDLVDCIEAVVERCDFRNTEIYNVAGKEIFSLNDAVDILKKKLNVDFEAQYVPVGKMEDSLLNIRKAKQKFDWEPKISLKDGVAVMMKNFRL